MSVEIIAFSIGLQSRGAEIPRMFASQARAVRRTAKVYSKTEMAPRLTKGTSQQTPSGTEDRSENGWRKCYQTCYHFLEKTARNRMNQGPAG
jgi:hypothetical protein